MSDIFNSADQIAAELAARLAEISVASGFNTDIGHTVYRGRRHIDKDQVPCAVLIEADDQVDEKQGIPNIKIRQEYVLGGYAICDPDHPNDTAHKIIKDLKRAVFGAGMRLGKRGNEMTYQGRGIGPRTDGAAVVFAVIYLTVEYAENLAAP
jgi:hypothetical protein